MPLAEVNLVTLNVRYRESSRSDSAWQLPLSAQAGKGLLGLSYLSSSTRLPILSTVWHHGWMKGLFIFPIPLLPPEPAVTPLLPNSDAASSDTDAVTTNYEVTDRNPMKPVNSVKLYYYKY